MTSRRSTTGSSSAPKRLYWPVSARRDAVGVVGPRDRGEQDRRRAGRSRSRSQSPRTRNSGIEGEADEADAVRQRPDVPRRAGQRRGRRRPRAVEADEAAEREAGLLDLLGRGLAGAVYGRLRHSSATASAAPSSGTPPSWSARPRRTCASTAPDSQRALAEREPQRHAEQLGVRELLARAGVAVVVEHVDARAAQLLVELLRRLALGRARAAERRRARRPTARSRAARRCPSRRRTARPRPPRCAPGRCRRSPSR